MKKSPSGKILTVSALAATTLLAGCSSNDKGSTDISSDANSISKVATHTPNEKRVKEAEAKIVKGQVRVNGEEQLILTFDKSFTKDSFMKSSHSNDKTLITLNLSKKVNDMVQDDFFLDFKKNTGEYFIGETQNRHEVKNITPTFNGDTITIPLDKKFLRIDDKNDFQVRVLFTTMNNKSGPLSYQSTARTSGFNGKYSTRTVG